MGLNKGEHGYVAHPQNGSPYTPPKGSTTGWLQQNAALTTILTVFVLNLTGLLLVASLFLPVTIRDHGGLERVSLGRPLPFIVQDQSTQISSIVPDYFVGSTKEVDAQLFPWTTHFISPWENPVQIQRFNLLFNGVIVAGLIWLLVYGLRRWIGRRQRS